MSDKITVNVKGIPEALERLKKYQAIKREACSRVLKETGFKIEADAKKDCPVKYGRARASLTTNWSGSGIGRQTPKSPIKNPANPTQPDDGIGQPQGPKGLVVVVGSNVHYVPYLEFGSFRALKVGGYRGRSGKLFLTKAYLKHEGEALRRIKKVFKDPHDIK